MPEPRAVLFDVWHTLAYLEPAEEERYMAAQLDTVARVLDRWPRSSRSRHPPLHDALRAAEEVRIEAARAAHEGVSMSLGLQAIHAARKTGRVPRPLELGRALADLVEKTPFLISPGAVEALGALQARGFRLGVISNSVGEPGDALQKKLDGAGIGHFIEAWAFSDQLPWAKPAPEIFWHCLGMLSTRRERAVHVGDGWSDVQGARAAGLRAAIMYTGAHAYGEAYRRLFAPTPLEPLVSEYQVNRLGALPELAERLLSR
ncbi:MAG: HAD family hydrolase [Thermoplasmata archaeon]|nr:HAD family hydrolase [Thermoplasmata archaeon]